MYTVKTKRRKAPKPKQRKKKFVSPFANLLPVRHVPREISAEEYYTKVGMEIHSPSDTLE